MTFPNLIDYKQAIGNASARLATLDAVPVADPTGAPHFVAGNFAGVFKMQKADGSLVALKCFTRTVPQLERRYKEIAAFAKSAKSPYFIGFDFLPDELYVTSKTVRSGDYPVLCMPWVEARSLGAVAALLVERKKPVALARLAQAWARLCLHMVEQGVAHGDLKHDNVLVTSEGRLRLIDYDSVFLPGLRGLKSPSLGSPNFQHPHRNEGHFDADIDHVSMLSLLVSLRHLVFQPDDHARYHNGENLLFRRDDFLNPAGSELFKRVAESPDLFVRDWAGGLAKCCAGRAVGIPGVKAALKAAVKLEAAPEQPGMKWFFYRRLA